MGLEQLSWDVRAPSDTSHSSLLMLCVPGPWLMVTMVVWISQAHNLYFNTLAASSNIEDNDCIFLKMNLNVFYAFLEFTVSFTTISEAILNPFCYGGENDWTLRLVWCWYMSQALWTTITCNLPHEYKHRQSCNYWRTVIIIGLRFVTKIILH